MSQRPFSFVYYMMQYGVCLGCLVGFFGAITLILMGANFAVHAHPQLAIFALVAGMFGGIIGMFYGAISGFASGLMMALVTRLAFREIKRHNVYKLMMGITVIVTLAILLAIPVWHNIIHQAPLPTEVDPMFGDIGNRPLLGISPDAWYSLLGMSVVFAVYANQQVATEYLREIDPRKSKVR